jgi:hypothetical protein
MNNHTPNRRELNRWAVAALGGLLTGTITGCTSKPQGADKAVADKQDKGDPEKASLLLQDPHVCRGINTCQNKGKPGTTNACAGQGTCATVASHDCQGMNDCKGQGGCGEHPGQNDCKGQGGCAVPLSDKTWPKARKRFEELMAKAAKKVGDAPPKKG